MEPNGKNDQRTSVLQTTLQKPAIWENQISCELYEVAAIVDRVIRAVVTNASAFHSTHCKLHTTMESRSKAGLDYQACSAFKRDHYKVTRRNSSKNFASIM